MLALAIAAILFVPLARAEIVDRIAVSVGPHVITQSELLKVIRVTAFLNGEKPDFSPAARRKAAEILVQRKLVSQELALGHYAEETSPNVDDVLEHIRKERAPGDGQYRKMLAEYAITDGDVRDYLTEMKRFAQFTEIRFQPAIEVSEEEVRKRFERQRAAEADRSRNGQKITYEDLKDQIEREIVGERVNQELEVWLKAARSRTRVKFHEEAFK